MMSVLDKRKMNAEIENERLRKLPEVFTPIKQLTYWDKYWEKPMDLGSHIISSSGSMIFKEVS